MSQLRTQAIKVYEAATGRRFLACLDELRQTQWLKRVEIQAIQQKHLHQLLSYAYQYVAYYRRTFDQAGFKPDDILRDPAAFHRLPTITKATINENFAEMVTTDPQRQNWVRNSTGGSTGTPLNFAQDSNFRNYVTADIHRHIEWTGWKLGEPHAYIWGADYEVASQQQLRTRLMDWALNRFVTNAFLLSEASMAAFAREIQEKKPKVLFGYASALTRFAEYVRDTRLPDLKFVGVISTAEVLFPNQREVIESTFSCRVLDRYGTRELGGVACESPAQPGLMLISAENLYVEVLRDDQPVPVGEAGDLVVTVLRNYALPFIRYHIGDVGQLSDELSPCGRGLPAMKMIQGRATDMFKTKDGTAVHGEFFTHLFYGIAEVEKFQVVQKSLDLIVVNVVQKAPLPTEKELFIEKAIKDIMKSDVEVRFEFLDDIPLKASGKYRFTISEVQ
jgi:phenylacetate-CoA ligase